MKQFSKILIFLVVGVFLAAGSAMAADITIYDNRSSSLSGWYGQQEDNEVEPGMVATQAWDLEKFTLTDYTLGMVGGYNFVGGYQGTTSGDIFISTGAAPTYGVDGGDATKGYEYAIDIDWSGGTYKVYTIGQGTLGSVTVSQNISESNPWQFNVDSSQINSQFSSGSFLVTSSGSSYTVNGFDLSWLGHGTEFYSHFTISCGNDNLMGHGTTPTPEPATMLLLGTGLVGLAGLGKKKFLSTSACHLDRGERS